MVFGTRQSCQFFIQNTWFFGNKSFVKIQVSVRKSQFHINHPSHLKVYTNIYKLS